jgi:hypothetical protein
MNRRGFLGTLAALGAAPFLGAFNRRSRPLLATGAITSDYQRWSNHTAVYADVTKEDIHRALRLAVKRVDLGQVDGFLNRRGRVEEFGD